MDLFDELRNTRLEKLKKMESMGVNPYGCRFDRTHKAADILSLDLSEGEEKPRVSAAGRIMSLRRMGGAGFAHLQDDSGRIQIYSRKDQVDEKTFDIFKLLDLGDIIGVEGTVFTTRTGEITISIESLTVLAKSLRPLPIVKEKIQDDEKIIYDQFADKESRYRKRYVDLLVNPDVMEVFRKRSKIVSSMRRYLEGKGYLEVETPILQPLYGGAFARPFTTHHHRLDMTLYLRIADELYLKRLIVGGFEGVYEISKDFRNEGMDRDHNPEFTMMELYVAFEDYHFMMNLVEDMLASICRDVHGDLRIPYGNSHIDFTPPWKRLSYFEAIKKHTGMDLSGDDLNTLKKAAAEKGIQKEKMFTEGAILDAIFSQCVEPHLLQPTFIMDYPVEISPLARKHRNLSGVVERFEGYIMGREICNAFSELNDPLDQRERFENQAKLRDRGDEEAMVIDEDYLGAMEYGMPPMGGLGIGIDRLVMLLTDSASIRDVILFPQMRPEIDSSASEKH